MPPTLLLWRRSALAPRLDTRSAAAAAAASPTDAIDPRSPSDPGEKERAVAAASLQSEIHLSLPLLRHSSPSPTRTRQAPGDDAGAAALGSRVQARQAAAAHTTTTIPAGYGSLHSGPDPGTVVGITLGSVGGFILLMWLIYMLVNMGRPVAEGDVVSESVVSESVGTASVLMRKRRSDGGRHHHHHHHSHHHRDSDRERSRHRHHHHHRSPRRETVEIRTGRGPIVVEERGGGRVREVSVVDTTRTRRASRPPPRVVADDEDEVVVIEEDTPPRRHHSRRRSSGGR